MKTLIPLLTWRYIRSIHAEHTIHTMTKICFGGIVMSTFALALTVFIMHGFEQATYEKLQSIHPQIIVRAHGNLLHVDAIKNVLDREFCINVVSPAALEQSLIQNNADQTTHVIMLKGINGDNEARVSTIEQKLIASENNQHTLADCIEGNRVVIGQALAKELHVTIGDTISLLCPDTESTQKRTISFTQQTAIVGGIFNTGIDEFDTSLCYCSLDFLLSLYPESGITELSISLDGRADEHATIEALQQRLGLEVSAWHALYPALVSALKLEKYAMCFILALIILIACSTIIALEFMHIVHKREDIAILKAMGISSRALRTIFITMGILVAGSAALIGLALATAVGFILIHYPCIQLPDAYYVSHVPISIEWYHFVLIFSLVMIISFIATWIPTRRIAIISVATLLRSET
jgi:lipoprotein-releasing system permease protein